MAISSTFIPHKTPDAVAVTDTVANFDPFYPAVSLAGYRKEYRNDDTVSDERLKENIETAILFINKSLRKWQIVRFLLGTPLTEAELQLYRRAVYHRTKVMVLGQYRDIDTTADGNEKSMSMNIRVAQERTLERETIRLLTGRNRTTIELI